MQDKETLLQGHVGVKGIGKAASGAVSDGPDAFTVGGSAATGGEAPFPCLKSNNCDSNQRTVTLNDLTKWQSSVLKQAHALTLNVETFFQSVGVERVGFLTLTTPDHLSYWTKEGWNEASRRYHNFTRRVLPSIFGQGFRWIKVMEPTLKGRIHFHLLVECPGDIRTGVDWDAFGKGDYRSAPPALRRMWAMLRKKAPMYGMGRCELLPIRTNVEACKRYVGKYIGKAVTSEWGMGHMFGQSRPRHARRIAYSAGWRTARSSFAWVDKGREWRNAVGYVAGVMGFHSPEEFVRVWGKRWAYHRGESIMAAYQQHKRECINPPVDRVQEEIDGRIPAPARPGVAAVLAAFGGRVSRVEGVPLSGAGTSQAGSAVSQGEPETVQAQPATSPMEPATIDQRLPIGGRSDPRMGPPGSSSEDRRPPVGNRDASPCPSPPAQPAPPPRLAPPRFAPSG